MFYEWSHECQRKPKNKQTKSFFALFHVANDAFDFELNIF